jgi:iron-sulfur cluster assembly protein
MASSDDRRHPDGTRRRPAGRWLDLLELTPSTVKTVRDLSDASGKSALRIFVDPRGHEDLVLTAALVDEPAEGDEVVEDAGAMVYLDAGAAEALDEKRLDACVTNGKLKLAVLDR